MIPVVTPDEIRAIDAAAPEPVGVLIERAGAAVARAALRMLGGAYGRTVTVLAGPGNNGADGRVAADRLRERGVAVRVLDARDLPPSLERCDLLVDAAFGTGFRGSWTAPECDAGAVLAVDVPTGLDARTGRAPEGVLHADVTVTFQAAKPGHVLLDGPDVVGELVVADIGLDVSAAGMAIVERDDVAAWLPQRPRTAHKWRSAVRLVAGSPGMTGAAVLAARAAQRAGSGMVVVSSPGLDPGALGTGTPVEAVGRAIAVDGWDGEVLADLHRFGALVIGPGLGRADWTVPSVVRTVTSAAVPTVVDGDGLFAMSWNDEGTPAFLRGRDTATVLTPHDGEYALLTGSPPGDDRVAAARHLVDVSGCVVLLKGPTTIVAEPGGQVWLVDEGDQRLATAGTGDVLAGVIGGVARERTRRRSIGRGRRLVARPRRQVAARARHRGRRPRRRVARGVGRVAVTGGDMTRWAWAEIDVDAIAHNVGVVRDAVFPAAVWAVVKADGYGHGAVAVSRAALDAGAAGLCVALTSEGVALRDAGITAPVLVLSQQPAAEVPALVSASLTPTVYSAGYADAVAAAAQQAGCRVGVHLKVDSGMQRVGASPSEAADLAVHVQRLEPVLRLDAVFTHLACADTPEHPANRVQLDAFDAVLGEMRGRGSLPGIVHAANSAAALAVPGARHDLVRAGIALYGISPGPLLDGIAARLRPAMSLRARVAHVKPVRAGSHVSYGWRHRFERDTVVATLPVGYADGVPRRLGTLPDRPGADVLIGGRRCPIVGVVTMDQTMVDVGDAEVVVGDEAVLIGRQGDEVVRAEDWADRLGTIGYEIVCGLSARVPRVVARR